MPPRGHLAHPPHQSLTRGEPGRRVGGQGSPGGEAEGKAEGRQQEEESGKIFIMLSPQGPRHQRPHSC